MCSLYSSADFAALVLADEDDASAVGCGLDEDDVDSVSASSGETLFMLTSTAEDAAEDDIEEVVVKDEEAPLC